MVHRPTAQPEQEPICPWHKRSGQRRTQHAHRHQQLQQQQQQLPHVPRPLSLMLLLALLGVLQGAILTCAAGTPGTASLIVKFRPDELQVQAAAAGLPTAETAAAQGAAAAAVAARGGDAHEQERVAGMAAAAAAAAPSIAAATTALTVAAQQLGVRVLRDSPISTVFHGTVLTVENGDVQVLKEHLQRHALVDEVWIARPRRLPMPVDKSGTNSAATATAASPTASGAATEGSAIATGLSNVYKQYPELDGSGQLICLVDTGINYRLPLFGSCNGINNPPGTCRVVVGYDMVGDGYTGLTGSEPVNGTQPLDCYGSSGHGTAVASVAATSNGVAPGALLGIYRIFGCSGYASDAVIIPAIDRAVRDGCHIINLSCSGSSGYEERSPYRDVMQAAWDLGVVAVKSAGNSGIGGTYFDVDVSMAVGSISVCSVGDGSIPVDKTMDVSYFSSFGPNPELKLAPHVCAPGSSINTLNRNGAIAPQYGTSFSCPYAAGVLALWRQNKQRRAIAAGKALSLTDVSQTEAMRALVSTAAEVLVRGNALVEPVARCGGGVIQASAMLDNGLRATPMMLQLPSNLKSPIVQKITVSWDGATPPTPPSAVTYDVVHLPAFSVDIRDNWYGTKYSAKKSTLVANITFTPTRVVLRPGAVNSKTILVQFTLPVGLQNTPLLYSGLIRLVPVGVTNNSTTTSASSSTSSLGNSTLRTSGFDAQLVPITIPYQGYSTAYTSLHYMARSLTNDPDAAGSSRLKYARGLCYAPNSTTYTAGAIMDFNAFVPNVCTGGYAENVPNKMLQVSLAVLQSSPACSLRITLAPQVPIAWLYVDVLNASTNKVLGSLAPIDTSVSGTLVSTYQVWSFCLNFNGSYVDASTGAVTSLRVGGRYRLQAWAEGPVCTADASRGVKPRREKVQIKGAFKVVP